MRHAFSLIELVMVVAIIAVLAAVAAPRIASANAGARIEAVESRLTSESLAASESARATGTSRSIVIDADSDRFLVYGGHAGAVGSPLSVVDFGASPYSADITGWSQGAKGHVPIDGYGIFPLGIKVSVTIGGVSRTLTLDLPSLDSDASRVSAEGGSR